MLLDVGGGVGGRVASVLDVHYLFFYYRELDL